MPENKGAVVAIAHTHEKHRSIERVTALVESALLRLGGISQFVPPGATVLIKPNQTVYYSAEEGCTTDPRVVGALIRLCKKAGAERVQVGESSGGFFSSRDCMRITGMTAMAEREGAELIDLGSDEVPNRLVRIPDGRVIKEVPLPAPLLDADVIIDAPKAKNHHIEPISGALKNWVGSVNQSWRNFNHGDKDMIDRFLDIMSVTKPALCVVDALICGEGDGPIANLPHWAGCILASTDPVATDVSIARLLRRDWTRLEFAKKAEERGLGVREPIEYRGVPIEQVAFDAWRGHEGYDYLPLNFLVGKGVTLEGTIGHVKSVLDSMLARGEIAKVLALTGTPTIMIGEVDDPNFEEHLKEGPYIVFDDAAIPQYKNDSRVYFVPGHPVLRTAMPELMRGLGLKFPGTVKMKWEQIERQALHGLELGSPKRKLLAMGQPVGAAALVVGSILAGSYLLGKMASSGHRMAHGNGNGKGHENGKGRGN
ncbi:MAG TPA: DUF362 domain-containing protein [Verrucomicrobiae bacterium]|jgi:uncharacterized protein (DUF362 family)|nr:DUF362 domain-containing protein [Verrucomicrobiae bacterium]